MRKLAMISSRAASLIAMAKELDIATEAYFSEPHKLDLDKILAFNIAYAEARASSTATRPGSRWYAMMDFAIMSAEWLFVTWIVVAIGFWIILDSRGAAVWCGRRGRTGLFALPSSSTRWHGR